MKKKLALVLSVIMIVLTMLAPAASYAEPEEGPGGETGGSEVTEPELRKHLPLPLKSPEVHRVKVPEAKNRLQTPAQLHRETRQQAALKILSRLQAAHRQTGSLKRNWKAVSKREQYP